MVAFDALGLPVQRTMVWAPSFTTSKVFAHGMQYRWHPIYGWRIPQKHRGPKWDLVDDNTSVGRGTFWFHPATKPLSLMEKLVRVSMVKDFDKANILDPFAGSGTTLVAAKRQGLKATGIELSEEYCEVIVRRLRETPKTFAMTVQELKNGEV
jgi:hypothetical protein